MQREDPTGHKFELTILMPCLNEVQTLRSCIERAQQFLTRRGIHGEIVVADNGSTDGSPALAISLGARVVDVPIKGYGAALWAGMQSAQSDYIVMGDADGSYNFEAVDGFLDRLREGFDLVMGNRFAGGIRAGAMPWKNRYIGNPALTLIGRILFRAPVHDFHCGLRGFRRQAILDLDLQTSGMEFASEMIIKATLLNLRITEVATTLDPDGRDRPPHLRPWRDGWRHLRFMLLYSPRWLFLYPGLLLMVTGGGLGLKITVAPVLIGRVWLDVHTLLYCSAAVLLGFQSVIFAFMARIYAFEQAFVGQDHALNGLFKYVRLETGLIVGALLFFAGLGGSAFALEIWRIQAFGALDPTVTLRIAIPSVTAILLGGQTCLSSLFFSIIGLKKQRA